MSMFSGIIVGAIVLFFVLFSWVHFINIDLEIGINGQYLFRINDLDSFSMQMNSRLISLPMAYWIVIHQMTKTSEITLNIGNTCKRRISILIILHPFTVTARQTDTVPVHSHLYLFRIWKLFKDRMLKVKCIVMFCVLIILILIIMVKWQPALLSSSHFLLKKKSCERNVQ